MINVMNEKVCTRKGWHKQEVIKESVEIKEDYKLLASDQGEE